MTRRLIALAGNQNCGKTTLFNQLTGSNQHVGNFPGVTVEKKEGTVKQKPAMTVVDLPGIYSLSPYTAEEVVTRDFLVRERPDVVLDIVDATNIERNMYLTLQLMTLDLPMVIALNMMDEVRSNGGTIDIKEMERELGVFVVPISANKGEGIEELIERLEDAAAGKTPEGGPRRVDFCAGPVHKALHAITHLVEDGARRAGYAPRFAATKLVEGDPPMESALGLSAAQRDIVARIIREMEAELGTDREAAIADMRYVFIESLVRRSVTKDGESREAARSVAIDRILTHPVLAIPVFVGVMSLVFWFTFGPIGSAVSDLFAAGIDWLIGLAGSGLARAGVSEWMRSLVVDGALAGVGSVLSFLPVIAILFFFLSLLEDTGYMARAAFVLDALLRKIGLSGRSFVPMLVGFGCTVPAIMATRTLSSARDRRMTILLAPFMSCSAKVPVYAVFVAAFFPRHGALVMTALYFGGVVVAILSGLVLRRTLFRGNPVPFVLELPVYRMPSAKTVILHLREKVMDFVYRAFTIIFIGSLVVWFLTSLDWTFSMVDDGSRSILASIGSLIAPIFTLQGFAHWESVAALVSGFTAKEAVISTLSVVLPLGIENYFTQASAAAFLTFTLLYTPCVAAVAAMRRELGTIRWTVAAVLFQTGVAWLASAAVYQVAALF
ncbi:MAG TPA: ferrous iron transport protein B [Treponemataceae bacterium]|nr:ferrous iron transport protein B [Treponemataceae bacterium]